MENRENHYTEYIEDYLSGKLSAGEEEEFKLALDNNSELAAAYRFRIGIAQYWNEEEKYRATKHRVKEIMTAQKRSSRFQFKHFYLAASVILLIGVSVVLWRVVSPENSIKDLSLSSDTAVQQRKPVSVLEQPERASLYKVPETYTAQDSLIIIRKPEWPGFGNLEIRQKDYQTILYTYSINEIADSLIIHLQQFEPGTYQWTIEGSEISGLFTVKEIHD